MADKLKLIAYLSGGYPTMDKSVEMAKLYVAGGCDAIEWNFPPRDPHMEADYIAEKMAAARQQCDDYSVYMEWLARFKEKEPQAEVIPMLYQETVLDIGALRLAAYLKENGMEAEEICFAPEHLAALIELVDAGTINGSVAKEVFEEMFRSDIDPEKYVEEKGLKTVNDEGALRETIEQIVADNPKSVEDYHNGKEKAIGFLVGQTMKAMKGKADPGMVNKILKEIL